MKKYLAFSLLCLFIYGCSQESGPYPATRFTYADTNLSLVTPDNWSRTKIPSSNYQTIFTEIQYGIKPNIQLEMYVKQSDIQQPLEAYLGNKKRLYPNYKIVEKSAFQTEGGTSSGLKIKARRVNAESTPVIHINYVFYNKREVYIISATCAEPSLGQFESIFDNSMKTVKIY